MADLDLPGTGLVLLTHPAPEPKRERPGAGFSRATRRGGLTIRCGRAVHETILAGCGGPPGARTLYGEVVCEAIETLQRRALYAPRPEVVVKVDRPGLNEHHRIVKRLYAAIDRVLTPLVAEARQRRRAPDRHSSRGVGP